MLKVGLTGNIGSGKSIVAEIFSTLGIPVFHADEKSKRLLNTDAIKRKVLALFGKKILDTNGNIDRHALAGIVFSDPSSLAALDFLLHPAVIDEFLKWCDQYSSRPYVIQEAAILLESGYSSGFDRIIHVSCPPEIAIERVVLRDAISREEVIRRMNFQWSDEMKTALSDYVIPNDGRSMIMPHVLEIHQKILNLSNGKS